MTIIMNELETDKNLFNQKSDIFNLLYDIYNWQNFCAKINYLIGRFVKTNNIVQTPNDYLLKNYFEKFQQLPLDANIIKNFNMTI